MASNATLFSACILALALSAPGAVAAEKGKKISAEGSLERQVAQKVVETFASTLRAPSYSDIAKEFGISLKQLQSDLGGNDSSKVWQSLIEQYPDEISKARETLVDAYLNHIKTSGAETAYVKTPSHEELVNILRQKKAVFADFKVKHLQYLLGQRSNQGPKWKPVLFPKGMMELHRAAVAKNPKAFKKFKDDSIFHKDYSQETIRMVEKARGFVTTTALAGLPVDNDFFEALVRYAEKRDFVILIFPANQETFGLSDLLINHPRVRIIVDTIEWGENLRTWALPIMPRNMRSLAGTATAGQGPRYQSQIVGGMNLEMESVAHDENDTSPRRGWSPGMITENIMTHATPYAGRTTGLAKGRIKKSALVFEKSDIYASPLQQGAAETWHPRNLEFFDDRDYGGRVGFTDLGMHYGPKKISKMPLTTLVPGDIHDWVSDQNFIAELGRIIDEFPSIEAIVLKDFVDGNSHNRHEEENISLMIQKMNKGETNIVSEINGAIQTLNALLIKSPKMSVIVEDANHLYWLSGLVAKRKRVTDTENAEFLGLLAHVQDTYSMSPWQFLIGGGREMIAEALRQGGNRLLYEKFIAPLNVIYDPARVKMLDAGENFSFGPKHRLTKAAHHGHKGKNGSRGTPKQHIEGADRTIIGDSHSDGIIGTDKGIYVNPGTGTRTIQPYSRGGYSSWGQGMAFGYADGSVQLAIWDSGSRSWRQDPKAPILPAKEFFHSKPRFTRSDNEEYPEYVGVGTNAQDAVSTGFRQAAGSKNFRGCPL